MREADANTARTSWRRIALGMIVMTVALAGAAVAVAWYELVTPLPIAAEVIVSVPEGQGFAATVAGLHSRGVVRRVWPLRLWARWNGFDRQIQSGDFRFEGALSPMDVLAILRSPPNAIHRVTIPEGTTVRGVAAILAAAGLGPADMFLRIAVDPALLLSLGLPASGAEGYLFPDTYEWPWSITPEAVLRALVQRFREVAATFEEQRRARGMSEADMVTLAAMIEKETGVESERTLVSAVFHNRLRLGMRLQSDPTAVYGRDELTLVPTRTDLLTDSPYNTYLHPGLPAGPICNPGRASLQAALTPADAPHLYFVARSDGGHEFSVSLDDHNRAVERYRRAKREGG